MGNAGVSKSMRRIQVFRSFSYAPLAIYVIIALVVVGVLVHRSFLSAGEISDSFAREVTNGWGSVGSEHHYKTVGPAETFAVNGKSGTLSILHPNGTGLVYLDDLAARDVEVRFRVSTDKPAKDGNLMVYFGARQLAERSQYLGRLRFSPEGEIWLQGLAEIDGTATLIGGEKLVRKLAHKPNKSVWLRGQVVGANPTTLRLKAWADGTREPSDWQYIATDSTPSLQQVGAVGLRAYVSTYATNTPVVFTFDDFHVTSFDFVLNVP